VLLAVLGAAAQVHAGVPDSLGGGGPVSIAFSLGSSLAAVAQCLLRALPGVALMMLPWLGWRRLGARAFPA
jgi:hypothetical protein